MQNERLYKVSLDGEEIGTTKLELADPPMGVVWGKLLSHEHGTTFWRDYCVAHGIQFDHNAEYPYIQTMDIPTLKVLNDNGVEIKGLSTNINGGDDEDGLNIEVLGISYPFYEEEFPEHVNKYNSMF